MADNSTQGGTDTIRDKDRAGVKTQIFGTDLNIGGASEVLETAAALADATSNPTISGRSSFGMLWNGTTWDRAKGTTANGQLVDVSRIQGALPAGTNNIGDIDVLTLPSLPAGAAIIGKVDINSAPQVAVNNVETITDNAGFTDGTSKVFPQGYIFDETAGTGLTENDIAAGRVDSKRAIVNVIEDATTRGTRAAVAAAADGLANSNGQVIVGENELFNGSTWDRQHNNWRTTTGDTGTKIASFNGATQTNFEARGAYITIRLGTVSGTTPTMAINLQWSPDAGTTWMNVNTALANLTTTSQLGLIAIYPTNFSVAGASPTALSTNFAVSQYLNSPLPRTWRLQYTIGGSSPSFALTAVDVNYQT